MNKQEILKELEQLDKMRAGVEPFSDEWEEICDKSYDLRHYLRMYEDLSEFETEVEEILNIRETIKKLNEREQSIKQDILKRSGIVKGLVFSYYGQDYIVSSDNGWSRPLNKNGKISKRDSGRRVTIQDLKEIEKKYVMQEA